MRRADRIDPLLDELRRAWLANPDLRLGQLVYRACGEAGKKPSPCPELFYMEDEAAMVGLTRLAQIPSP